MLFGTQSSTKQTCQIYLHINHIFMPINEPEKKACDLYDVHKYSTCTGELSANTEFRTKIMGVTYVRMRRTGKDSGTW